MSDMSLLGGMPMMPPTDPSNDKGWSRTADDVGKYHYFDSEGRSLCGKASSEGVDEFTPHTGNADPDEAGPNDCGLCMRALSSRGVQ